jgi:pilus assembly protein Flp/PilA
MRDFILKIAARRDSEDGQAMVEYGLILALVSVVAVGVLTTIGLNIQGVFTTIANALPAA